jgi:anaerobic selenocysteine-containing dehydrogenase
MTSPPLDGLSVTPLESFPPPDKWDHWEELDAKAWPRRVKKTYQLVPTICFNCEAACGLVAYVDKETKEIRKLEGNPYHPGSRGRNCAKGPATLNQVNDPDRIYYPLKRVGARGSGQFARTTWDEVLTTIGARIRKAILEDRKTEVMYHVGRPGHDGIMERTLQAWGVDGHNSHTNVCSSSARVGYTLVTGYDRPSPDYANAKFILLISAHLETGHYFNPHAQRVQEAKMKGAKLAVCDIRLSNSASMADYWLAPRPGTETLMLLGFLHVILRDGLVNEPFVRDWVDWRGWLAARGKQGDVAAFLADVQAFYAFATPEHVAATCGLERATIERVAREIGQAGPAFSAHVWRNTASGNEGGWEVARALAILGAMLGAIGSVGGTSPNGYDKFVPKPHTTPSPQEVWSELLYPREWPFAHHEMSFLLPHLLKDGRGKLDTYFTRVYHPVWTNPDGLVWIEALRDETLVGCHAALTPVWSETARWADYVLPMGVATERHDLMSQETHAAKWLGFRQPVLKRVKELAGEKVEWSYQANPGEVWEEDEFWIALSWQIDPDGALGIRKHFESPYRKGERITTDEYYRYIFENSVPGLPAAAQKEGLTPLEYMKRHGAFLVEDGVYETHAKEVKVDGAALDARQAALVKDGKVVAPVVDGKARAGFPTASKRLELHSQLLAGWGFADVAFANYLKSHVDESKLDRSKGECVLVSTFRLPTLIHTRSANSKWLTELSNTNPVWIHPQDAARLSVATGDLVRVTTRIGYYVNKAWVTEGVRPGLVACSHHLGRFRQRGEPQGVNRWQQHESDMQEIAPGQYLIRRTMSVSAFDSADTDSKRVWWRDGGVHQNFTFPVQPDPVSGMHCWHQKVVVSKAPAGDQYGDTFVDTNQSMAVYREWVKKARPGPGPGGLRRPLELKRVARPSDGAYRVS